MDKCLLAITPLMTDEEVCQSIGERVALMRSRKGLSEKDLSQLSGLSIDEIKSVETKGEISLSALIHLARVMNPDTYGALDQMFRSPKFKSLDEYQAYWEANKDMEEQGKL